LQNAADLAAEVLEFKRPDTPALPRLSGRPLLIGVPFYKNERLVGGVVRSLIACAAELGELGAEVVLYNDSPGYAPLEAALDEILPLAQALFPIRIEENAENLGFLRTMNRLIGEGVARGFDVLMLNSDTVVFPGALREMVRVAASDPMIGFVNPRSNNATLATLPLQTRFRDLAPEAAYRAFLAIAPRLPAISYTPTAVGFCMLCRWKVLAEFGDLDEIYDLGYHEENDLVMRANRCGYRAVLANQAFVWHAGEASFALLDQPRKMREAKNRDILFARYPEYDRLTREYFHSPEHRAEQLLGALIPDGAGKIDVAFDFSAFGAYHNGTFMAGRQLLSAAVDRWSARFNIAVLCSPQAYRFHDFAALGVERRDPLGPQIFGAIFRVGQPYSVEDLQLLTTKAAVVGLYMLDTISIDCGYLSSPRLYNLWQFALDHVDLVATTSQLTTDQLARRFRYGEHVVRVRAMHSLDLDDYRSADGAAALDAPPPPPHVGGAYLLVVGNKFPHKYVIETANALAEAYPALQIVALGAPDSYVTTAEADVAGLRATERHAPARLSPRANILVAPTGDLSATEMTGLYSAARAIVFPTHYEGFGFPLLNALAAETPIFARRNPALEEVWRAQGSNPNVHFFDLTTELVALLSRDSAWVETPPSSTGGDAARAADDILHGLEAAIQGADYHRIVARIRAFDFAHDIAQTQHLTERLQSARSKLRQLQEQVLAAEQSLVGRMVGWARRHAAAHPQIWRRLSRLATRIVNRIKPLPPQTVAIWGSHEKLIAQSGVFDGAWYVARYEDVGETGQDPFRHFIDHGLEEGRDPGPAFSTRFYLQQNPDVFDSGLTALVHYLAFGRAEGRKGSE
jgi:GT2 family glycosyltransferase